MNLSMWKAMVAGLAVSLLVGCASVWETTTDLAALDRAVDEASVVIDERADDLPEADREVVLSAWSDIMRAHQALRGGDKEALYEYHNARFAYAQLRDVVERHWDALGPHEQLRAQEIDHHAQRLDQRIRENGIDRHAREVVEVATMLAPYIGALSR